MSLPYFPPNASALLALADGTVFCGKGIGVEGITGGEVCFNTSMTGYQESLTDPSYAGQIITFTFPHIGNVGTNDQDNESTKPFVKGLILRNDITSPSSHRSEQPFISWLKEHKLTGICGIDTRALTLHLRNYGAQNGVICFSSERKFNQKELIVQAKNWPSMYGIDIAKTVSTKKIYQWHEQPSQIKGHVVVIDYGVKHNILHCLAAEGFRLTVVPCTTPADEILALRPDGIFLSNGPGDPAATGVYAVPTIQKILKSGLPLFGICLGHQLLALALGGSTAKLPFGHRGANHPVKNLETGKIEITSQNHGFHVIPDSLPDTIEITHTSLFDNTNEGFRLKEHPVFSVQYHPEASPGPQDSRHLFEQFSQYIADTSGTTILYG
ncbi:MAG: glutamine-hydrolyzing carbamoyl-phosphate synthase small subunit [Alphaproteobacteria bacterium]|nr:glutamine-hydrolyzing carbamoyl-phosphate synthase small subunit [Alphaproteobacteria bacterium]